MVTSKFCGGLDTLETGGDMEVAEPRCLTYQVLSALITGVRLESWVQLTARLVQRYIGVYRPHLWTWRLCKRIVASVRRQDRICDVYGRLPVPGDWYADLDEPVSDLVIYEVERAPPTVFHVEDVRQYCQANFWV